MVLDLADECLRVRLNGLAGGRARLTIDYPLEYRDQILAALRDLLTPAAPCSPRKRGRPRKTEATTP